MALDFTVKDIIHKIMAKFVPAYLPKAKKPYYLKAVFQPELDIHEIASKAEVYNIEAAPRVIEDGFNAASELILYLAADGCRIKTPLFTLSMRLPASTRGRRRIWRRALTPKRGSRQANCCGTTSGTRCKWPSTASRTPTALSPRRWTRATGR